jgi:hypothetical protein
MFSVPIRALEVAEIRTSITAEHATHYLTIAGKSLQGESTLLVLELLLLR